MIWAFVSRACGSPFTECLRVVAGLLVSPVVRSLFFGVSATDPISFAVVTVTILAVASAACFPLPAGQRSGILCPFCGASRALWSAVTDRAQHEHAGETFNEYRCCRSRARSEFFAGRRSAHSVKDALKDFSRSSEGRSPTRLLIQRGSFWSICALHSGIFWNSAAMLLINHRSSLRVTGQQRKPRRAIKTGMRGTIWEDLESMQRLVEDASIDLYAPIPHGDGQTVLREALLVADHNAYHLGQLVLVRRLLGAWND